MCRFIIQGEKSSAKKKNSLLRERQHQHITDETGSVNMQFFKKFFQVCSLGISLFLWDSRNTQKLIVIPPKHKHVYKICVRNLLQVHIDVISVKGQRSALLVQVSIHITAQLCSIMSVTNEKGGTCSHLLLLHCIYNRWLDFKVSRFRTPVCVEKCVWILDCWI